MAGKTKGHARASRRILAGIGLLAGTLGAVAVPALAGWETGAKAGFDSNLSRSVTDGEGDVYLGAYGGYSREPSGESRLDWTASAAVEGAAYAQITDLDYAQVTVSPGLVYFARPAWLVTASAFLRAKGVRDTDQSALAFGGKLGLRQRLRTDLYLGEYYAYTNSNAKADTFSFDEHAVGALLGKRWTPRVSSEVGYEFSRGDSFRSGEATAPGFGGMTGDFGDEAHMGMFSRAFGTVVARERVSRHAIGAAAQIAWRPKLFSLVSYTYSVSRGGLGTSDTHSGFAGLGYRF